MPYAAKQSGESVSKNWESQESRKQSLLEAYEAWLGHSIDDIAVFVIIPHQFHYSITSSGYCKIYLLFAA